MSDKKNISGAVDDISKAMKDTLEEMSPVDRENFLEQQRAIQSIVDNLERSLSQILSTSEGKKQFLSELKRRTGEDD